MLNFLKLLQRGACMLSHSVVSDSAILWTIACQILEWAAISYFRGSSWPRDQILVSCIFCSGRQILYHWEAPFWRGNPCWYTDVSIISFIVGIHTQIHPFTPVCFLEWDYNLHLVLQFAFCSHNNAHTHTILWTSFNASAYQPYDEMAVCKRLGFRGRGTDKGKEIQRCLHRDQECNMI